MGGALWTLCYVSASNKNVHLIIVCVCTEVPCPIRTHVFCVCTSAMCRRIYVVGVYSHLQKSRQLCEPWDFLAPVNTKKGGGGKLFSGNGVCVCIITREINHSFLFRIHRKNHGVQRYDTTIISCGHKFAVHPGE